MAPTLPGCRVLEGGDGDSQPPPQPGTGGGQLGSGPPASSHAPPSPRGLQPRVGRRLLSEIPAPVTGSGRGEAAAAQLQRGEPAEASPALSPFPPPDTTQGRGQGEVGLGSLTWAELGEKLRAATTVTPTAARNEATAKPIQSVLDGAGRCAAALPPWEPRQKEGTGVKINPSAGSSPSP